MDAGRFLPVSCESVGSERARAGHLLQGGAHRREHLQGLPHHVDLAAGLCRVVLVVDLLVAGSQVGGAVGVGFPSSSTWDSK